MTFEEVKKLLINPRNINLMKSALKDTTIVDISTNIQLWKNNYWEAKYLDEMGFKREDCGIFPGIGVDYIDYEEGNMEGSIGINGVSYNFELDCLEEDEMPLFTEREWDFYEQ